MRIGVISLFPAMFDALRVGGITARALQHGIVDLQIWNPRDFTMDKHRRVDDRPFGGGSGMVMQVQPLRAAVQAAKHTLGAQTRTIYLSPQGRRLDHAGIQDLLHSPTLLLVNGRYEGVDERFLTHDIDEEWSIGDYVLSGGELATMVLIDALTRWLPNALGDMQSAQQDSFCESLLDYPHYTRPEVFDGQAVPAVLLGGNHAEIARWRHKQALGRTWQRRPDLLDIPNLSPEQRMLLAEYIEEHED